MKPVVGCPGVKNALHNDKGSEADPKEAVIFEKALVSDESYRKCRGKKPKGDFRNPHIKPGEMRRAESHPSQG